MLPKPMKVSGPAGPTDPTSLAELAEELAETSKEVYRLSEQILSTLKARDLLVDKTRIFARCSIDAYTFLARQLRDLSARDESLLKLEDEKFWWILRCVMDLWQNNAEQCVVLLKRDPRIQTNIAGKVWQSFRAKAEMLEEAAPKWQEATFEDLELVSTLFALHVLLIRDALHA